MPRFHVFGLAEFVLTIDFRLIGGLGFLGYSVARIYRGVILIVLHLPRLNAEELNGAQHGGEDSDDDASGGPAEPLRPPTPRLPRETEGRGRRRKVAPERVCEHHYGCE